MSKRVHDCFTCDGKTRHDGPPICATCRLDENIAANIKATR